MAGPTGSTCCARRRSSTVGGPPFRSGTLSSVRPSRCRVRTAARSGSPPTAKRPIVLDTRGGYKDYFRGHLPLAHHINFDTLRGTDNGAFRDLRV